MDSQKISVHIISCQPIRYIRLNFKTLLFYVTRRIKNRKPHQYHDRIAITFKKKNNRNTGNDFIL